MFSTLLTVALFASVAVNSVVADFAINSPKLEQCKEASISWEPTKGPYTLLAVRASDPCGDALVDIGDFTTTITSWKANVPEGTDIILSVVDADDNEAWSHQLTVGPSDDKSCLNTASSSADSPTSSSSSTPPANVASGTGSGSGSSSGSSPNGGVEALGGAANAGANPFSNGALSARQASVPVAALAAMAAFFALL